jgi:flagellar biosynthetic protein FlhB
MAADSDMDKTEDPTSKKLSDAAEKGNIARSKDLATALVLVGSCVGLLLYGAELAHATLNVARRLFSLPERHVADPALMFTALKEALFIVTMPFLKLSLVIVLAGIIGNTVLGGFNFAWYSASFRFDRLDPLAGIKRMFSLNALVELLKSILKVAVVCGSTYVLLKVFFQDVMALSMMTSPDDIIASMDLLLWIFFGLCASTLLIAAVDAPYQKWQFTNQMKMTKQEVKDEYKDSEGSPETKGRVRSMQMQISRRRMMKEVPKADVIVTNPTHYAVALKYEHGKQRAPVVVAKGVDEMAAHIRQIADAHKVPIVRSPALARAIYHTTELDKPIPEQLFGAVAQVLAYVYQLKVYRRGKGQKPKPLAQDLPIPDGFKY